MMYFLFSKPNELKTMCEFVKEKKMYPAVSMSDIDCNIQCKESFPSAPPQPPPFTATVTGIRLLQTGPPPLSSSGASHSPVPWSTGLCDCCQDVSTCMFYKFIYFFHFEFHFANLNFDTCVCSKTQINTI